MMVNNNSKQFQKKQYGIYGFAIVFIDLILIYFSWCLQTVSIKHEINPQIVFGVNFIAIITVCISCFYGMTRVKTIKSQLFCVTLWGICLGGLLTYDSIVKQDVNFVILYIIWVLVAGSIVTFVCFKQGIMQIKKIIRMRQIKNSCPLVFIIIGALFVAIRIGMNGFDKLHFRWDGLLYFLSCQDLNIRSISSLALYGHITQGYSLLVYMCKIIVRDTGTAMFFTNCILYIVGVIYFHRIVSVLISGISQITKYFMTLIFACSPWTMGMLGYFSLDYASLFLVLPVVYYLYKEEWVYFLVTAYFFCFSKEPAVIVYACLYLGKIVADYLTTEGPSPIIEYFLSLFKNPLHYINGSPLLFWFITYKILGPWSAGDGSFAFDLSYIIEKCKAIFILDFNWIFVVGILTGCVLLLKHRKGKEIIVLLPMLLAIGGFTLFCCSFATINHARYVGCIIGLLYLLGLIMIIKSFPRCYHVLILCVLSAVLLGQSFANVDILSKLAFSSKSENPKNIINVADSVMGDGILYNFQGFWQEFVLDMALKDALEEGTIVVFPTYGNNAYAFDGMAYVEDIKDAYRIDNEFWNVKMEKRVPLSNENTISFQVVQATDKFTAKNLLELNGTVINYIYLDTLGQSLAVELMNTYNQYKIQTYSYRGWKINRLSISIR